MSVDVQKVMDAVNNIHLLWALPIQVAITLYLIYQQLEWAFLAGLGVLVVFLPLNMVVARRIGSLTADMMMHRDKRVEGWTETVKGIFTVKMWGWEDIMQATIDTHRGRELKYLGKRKYLDALCVFLWASTPVLVSLATFGTVYGISSQHGQSTSTGSLSPAQVFTALSLLNMLIFPMNAFPWVLTGVLEARVSLRRLNKLILHARLSTWYQPREELSDSERFCEPTSHGYSVTAGAYCWPTCLAADDEAGADEHPESRTSFCLQIPDGIAIRRRALCVVVGPVASGKTAFLQLLLGEMTVQGDTDAQVRPLNGRIAYVGQKAWLRKGSVADNVRGFTPRDQTDTGVPASIEPHSVVGDWDRDYIVRCLEQVDLAAELHPEQEVADMGTNLSGGQRMRLCIARALYSSADVVVMDDPVSALDTVVLRKVWQRAIHENDRTRIVSTSQSNLAREADVVIELQAGRVVYFGPPSEWRPHTVCNAANDGDTDAVATAASSNSAIPPVHATALNHVQDVAGDAELDAQLTPDDASDTDSVTKGEHRRAGRVEGRIVGAYIKAAGLALSVAVLSSLLGMQLSRNAADWWLSQWAAAGSSDDDSTSGVGIIRLSDHAFFTVFAIIASVNVVFTAVRAVSFAAAGLRASHSIHMTVLRRVLRAPMQFFDSTPIGRLINRFSTDQ